MFTVLSAVWVESGGVCLDSVFQHYSQIAALISVWHWIQGRKEFCDVYSAAVHFYKVDKKMCSLQCVLKNSYSQKCDLHSKRVKLFLYFI